MWRDGGEERVSGIGVVQSSLVRPPEKFTFVKSRTHVLVDRMGNMLGNWEILAFIGQSGTVAPSAVVRIAQVNGITDDSGPPGLGRANNIRSWRGGSSRLGRRV